MNHGKYSDDKYSRDLDYLKADFLPASKESAYFENFDQIQWDEPLSDDVPRDGYRIIRGKAREAKSTQNLYIKETVNAARTPITERKGVTGEETYKYVS